MTYASIADLKAATAEDIDPEDERALRLLQFADAKIDAFCGRSFPLTENAEVPLIVVQVAAALAARAWLNPAGAQSTSETAGPFGFNTTFGPGQSMASVPLALRASEKDDLARYKVRRTGIGTVATERPITVSEEYFVNVTGGDKPFPWPNPDAL